jgi:plastocyanin
MKTLRQGLWLAALVAGSAHAATVQITVLARDGQPLADAVVLIEPVAGARPAAPVPLSTTITQQKMQFVPAVSIVPLGSRVTFSNLDGWEHHVRGLPAGLAGLSSGHKGFEMRLAGKEADKDAARSDLVMDKPGAWQLGCHLHGSMRGFIYVTDSPLVAKTGADGTALLNGVPEGAARVRVWHGDQLVDATAVDIDVSAASQIRLPTQVQPRRRR